MLLTTTTRVFRINTRRIDTRRIDAQAAGQPEPLFNEVRTQALAAGEVTSAICLSSGELAVVGNGDGSRRLPTGVDQAIESVAILAEEPLHLLLGTADARVFRFREADGSARPLNSFDQLACRSEWYTPWGGPPAVRSLAVNGSWVYADIHVGSIMRSPDSGEHWEPVVADLHEDVHQVTTSAVLPERVCANTANGVYVSDDRGQSWEHRSSGLTHRYGRAIAVDPRKPDLLLASVSRGPHRNVDAQLFRSEDAGRSWTHVTDGFPSTSDDNIDTFQLAFDAQGSAWAAVAEILYVSVDAGKTWQVSHHFEDPIQQISCPPH